MRKIKNIIFLLLSVLPIAVYFVCICNFKEVLVFLPTVQTALGTFGSFFTPIIEPLLTEFVPLADSAGVALFSWLIGYYVTLILVALVFELFTFLITIFSNKIDQIRGGK